MTDVGYDPEVFTRDGLARVRASLPADIDVSAAMIDAAALFYRDLQARVDAGTGRGTKADLKAMHNEVSRAVRAISKPRFEIIGLVGVCGGKGAIPRLRELGRELAWLEETLGSILRRMGQWTKSHPLHLLVAIGLLSAAYERAAGARATHSLHRDGEYVGEPLSPFGKLVVAFFAEIDPALPKRTIGSAIRKQLAEEQRYIHDAK